MMACTVIPAPLGGADWVPGTFWLARFAELVFPRLLRVPVSENNVMIPEERHLQLTLT